MKEMHQCTYLNLKAKCNIFFEFRIVCLQSYFVHDIDIRNDSRYKR